MPNPKYASLEAIALGTQPGATTSAAMPAPGVGAAGQAPHGRITIAQAQLTAHGFSPGHPPNGAMTEGTTNALKAFQSSKGLTPTGVLDPRTQSALAGPNRTAGRGAGSKRMSGGPVLVSRPADGSRVANAAGGGGSHGRAGSGHTTHSQNRPQGAVGVPSAGILPRMTNGGPSATTATKGTTMQKQATYGSAGKRVPVIFASQGNIAAGATVSIVVQPQIWFRGENLVVDAATAANFSIASLQVGVTPQVAVGNGALPATLFAPNQNGALDYEMDLCDPGTQITLQVTNTSGAAAPFVCVLFGHEVQQTN
jgi:peptidoglycan hydrolase-like protein with peptidoglycan-binding domain